MRSTILRLGLVFAASALLGAISFHARAHVRITTNVTWAKEIRPILRQKCMPCHHPGGVAPEYVDLTTYGMKVGQTGARDWAKAIEEQVLSRRMPPWKADSRFGSFSNQRSLTQQEIDLIVAWSGGGAPQGTPRDLPVPEEFTRSDWSLGKPDLVVSMPREHGVGSKKLEDSGSFVIPVDLKEDRWITGYEFKPGNAPLVHRIFAFIHDPPGAQSESIQLEVRKKYETVADDRPLESTRERKLSAGTRYLGQWTPGNGAVLLADGAGIKLRKGSTVELRVVYLKSNSDELEKDLRDRSSLGLFFSAVDIDLLSESRTISNESFVIRAGERRQEVHASIKLDESVHLTGLHPELGRLGKDFEARVVYPDGKTLTLLWIPEYEYKWESTYAFETPVAAPVGSEIQIAAHYDNSSENPQNPNNPPRAVSSGTGLKDERLSAWVDFMLDDHLIITKAPPPTAPEPAPALVSPVTEKPGVGSIDRIDGSADNREIWWCPMRGRQGCGLKDYYAPGNCDVCKMVLIRKKDVMERYKDRIAAPTKEWTLTAAGVEEIYLCPNRGRPDHSLKEYATPGRCEICDTTLIHKARFEELRTWICLTESCPLKEKIFFSPGRCPKCGEPVEAMGHMDHNPVHGGVLFMAENGYHHLEGTHPSRNEFLLYFYDDYKRPLDPRSFAGRAILERWDPEKQAPEEAEYVLKLAKEGDMYLTARIPAPGKYPFEIIAKVWLAGAEKHFNFFFDKFSEEPAGNPASRIRLHKHGDRAPLDIPADALGVARDVFKRDRTIQSAIAAKNWFGLHEPAFDVIDLAAALKIKTEGLTPKQRKDLGDILVRLSFAADRLDKAGDASEEGRVLKYYQDFKKALDDLTQIFPNPR